MPSGRYLIGFDLGSSSVKVALLNSETGQLVGSATAPETEMGIASPLPGWAEQQPAEWWSYSVKATRQLLQKSGVSKNEIQAIGISYQMHGLVVVDQNLSVLRPSIIWCDSRAVAIGDGAYTHLGFEYCNRHLLNSPGNFTASKLRWVREHEPDVYRRIHKIMLPGDYLAMKMTGVVNTTVSGLSEGIFWDHLENRISTPLLRQYDIDENLLPPLVPTFGSQGTLTKAAGEELGLLEGTPVTYRAGDQPNNAFSLKTLHPGEVAATAGTSGVIYGIVNHAASDPLSRVNTFTHVNDASANRRLGVLLCVNGTGSMNSWLKRLLSSAQDVSYPQLNELASKSPIGADGLRVLPFGNGAERMLQNRKPGASIHRLDLNRHSSAHVSRAVQEGIVFALGYGFEVLAGMGIQPHVIRAGLANMFLSDIFCEAFAALTSARLELFNTDGAQGAARAAGVGAKIFATADEAFEGLKVVHQFSPDQTTQPIYQEAYADWKNLLQNQLDYKPNVS